ncbi:MAG: hypothetical protein R2695_06710 [Acidimicrobiales bacterium]
MEQRVAYALHDGTDIMRENAPAEVELVAQRDGTTVAGGTVARRDVDVITLTTRSGSSRRPPGPT